MKVLVATTLGQGKRKSDFAHATEGELVTLATQCDDRDGIDGRCGCRRAFAGLDTHLATTTATAEERDVTREQFVALLRDSQRAAGFYRDGDPEDEADLEEDASVLLAIAGAIRPGQVVEKRGANIQTRPLPEEDARGKLPF